MNTAELDISENIFSELQNYIFRIQYYLYEFAGRIHRNEEKFSVGMKKKDQGNEYFGYFGNFGMGLIVEYMKFGYGYCFPNETSEPSKNYVDMSDHCFIENQLPEIWLEETMDQMSSELTPLNHFIRPGGDIVVAQVHVCRTVCRDLERKIHLDILTRKHHGLREGAKIINRLSDWLFVLSRFFHQILFPGQNEEVFSNLK